MTPSRTADAMCVRNLSDWSQPPVPTTNQGVRPSISPSRLNHPLSPPKHSKRTRKTLPASCPKNKK